MTRARTVQPAALPARAARRWRQPSLYRHHSLPEHHRLSAAAAVSDRLPAPGAMDKRSGFALSSISPTIAVEDKAGQSRTPARKRRHPRARFAVVFLDDVPGHGIAANYLARTLAIIRRRRACRFRVRENLRRGIFQRLPVQLREIDFAPRGAMSLMLTRYAAPVRGDRLPRLSQDEPPCLCERSRDS